MSSFEPIAGPWMSARSFVAAEAREDGFVPTADTQSPDREAIDSDVDDEKTAPEAVAAEAREAIREAALAEAQQRLAPVMAALGEATAQLVIQRDAYLESQRRLLVDLAIEIAGHVVGRAVEADADSLCQRIGDALSLIPDDDDVTISLHPSDYDTLMSADEAASAISPSQRREITLQPDAALAPGDAVVSSGATSVDARMRFLLARVRDALLSGESTPDAQETEA